MLQDTELHQDLVSTAKKASKACDQVQSEAIVFFCQFIIYGRVDATLLHIDGPIQNNCFIEYSEQVSLFMPDNSEVGSHLRQVIDAIKTLEPRLDTCRGVSGPKMLSVVTSP